MFRWHEQQVTKKQIDGMETFKDISYYFKKFLMSKQSYESINLLHRSDFDINLTPVCNNFLRLLFFIKLLGVVNISKSQNYLGEK